MQTAPRSSGSVVCLTIAHDDLSPPPAPMPYDTNSSLWPTRNDVFFRDRVLRPQQQHGPHCVSTALAVLTGASPADFQSRINTQDPRSWSAELAPWGMQLAYCPTDVRKLKFYLEELLELDDLFTLSYYTSHSADEILGDPDATGWVSGSHIVVLHRDKIFDSAGSKITYAWDHACMEFHTKRIFRVTPA